jgi:hypothetical protein
MATIKLVTHWTASGASQTGLSPTIDILNSSNGSVLINDAAMTELAQGFYSYDYTNYTPGTEFLYLADSGSGASDTQLIAGSNESYLHGELWDTTISGIGHVTSYGDMLDDVFSIQKGKWEISGTDLILYELDGTTTLLTFNLDSATAPTIRTPA